MDKIIGDVERLLSEFTCRRDNQCVNVVLIEAALFGVFLQEHFKSGHNERQSLAAASHCFNADVFVLQKEWNGDGLDRIRTMNEAALVTRRLHYLNGCHLIEAFRL